MRNGISYTAFKRYINLLGAAFEDEVSDSEIEVFCETDPKRDFKPDKIRHLIKIAKPAENSIYIEIENTEFSSDNSNADLSSPFSSDNSIADLSSP